MTACVATVWCVPETKYMVRPPRGATKVAPYSDGTHFYFNASGFFEESFKTGAGIKRRINNYEKGLLGEIGDCKTVVDFRKQFLCFNRVTKVAGSSSVSTD